MSGFNVQKEAGTVESGSSTPKLPEPVKKVVPMFDVLFVNIKTGIIRAKMGPYDERNADAVIYTAVARRGVDEEFYCTAPAGKFHEGDVHRNDEEEGSESSTEQTHSDPDALLPNKEKVTETGTESLGGCC